MHEKMKGETAVSHYMKIIACMFFFVPDSISVSLSPSRWSEVLLLVTLFVFKAKASEVATSILAPILLHHRSIFLFF